jgi:hypothetical protein
MKTILRVSRLSVRYGELIRVNYAAPSEYIKDREVTLYTPASIHWQDGQKVVLALLVALAGRLIRE